MNQYLFNDNNIPIFRYPSHIPPMNDLYEGEFGEIVKNIKKSYILPADAIPDLVTNVVNMNVKFINILDSIFSNSNIKKLTKDTVLFRGMRIDPSDVKKYQLNKEITFKNFISCSINLDTSLQFSGKCCLFKIINIEEIPYIYLPWNICQGENYYTKQYNYMDDEEPISLDGDEYEVLLPRNLTFKVIQVRQTPVDISKHWGFTKFNSLTNKEIYKQDTIDEEYIKKNLDKILPNVLVITLEYVKQEPLKPVPDYRYTSVKTSVKFLPQKKVNLQPKINY